MPLYTFECEACTKRTDAHRSIETRDENPPVCDCGGKTERIITAANVNPDIFDGYFDPNLVAPGAAENGTWVHGRKHRRQLMKEFGVEERG